MNPDLYEYRPPIDLTNSRLRKLAAGLGPAFVRVSGTWANTTYFPDSDDAPKAPPAGKNTFRLIGISEFNFPQLRDRTVVIRGLLIKDKVSRINVTSAVEAVASCAPNAPK